MRGQSKPENWIFADNSSLFLFFNTWPPYHWLPEMFDFHTLSFQPSVLCQHMLNCGLKWDGRALSESIVSHAGTYAEACSCPVSQSTRCSMGHNNGHQHRYFTLFLLQQMKGRGWSKDGPLEGKYLKHNNSCFWDRNFALPSGTESLLRGGRREGKRDTMKYVRLDGGEAVRLRDPLYGSYSILPFIVGCCVF